MSISRVNNNISFKQTQAQEPLKLHKLDDESIYQIASYDSKQRMNKIAQNSYKTILFTIPVVDSVLAGMTKNGNLSSKFAKSAKTLGSWGAVFATGFAVLGFKKYINSKIDTLDNFDKNHRALSFVADLSFLYGALFAMSDAFIRSKAFVKKTFPNLLNNINIKAIEPVKKFINNSSFNNKLVKSFDSFMNSHMHYNKAAKLVALLAAPAIAIATMVRVSNEAKAASKQVEKNVTYLKAFNEMIPSENNQSEEIDAIKID